jgi:AbrB family looped-hinge helix DNA binding protein
MEVGSLFGWDAPGANPKTYTGTPRRQIDDIGRIVIPKSIRKMQGIQEGDTFEIIANNDGTITLRKETARED